MNTFIDKLKQGYQPAAVVERNIAPHMMSAIQTLQRHRIHEVINNICVS